MSADVAAAVVIIASVPSLAIEEYPMEARA
jgi:hypothetical protein